MTDPLDDASGIEMAQRQRAIDNQLAKAKETETPYEEDGIRYCLDCGEEIPAQRLEARPNSVRCVDCKEIKEQKEKHYA